MTHRLALFPTASKTEEIKAAFQSTRVSLLVCRVFLHTRIRHILLAV
jgi:hypothetical protein